MSGKTASEFLKMAKDQDYKHPDEAIAACNEALRLNLHYAEAYAERAKRLYDKKQYEDALADYSEALRINPDFIEAYLERGDLRDMKMGDTDGAIADYSEAIRADPYCWS